MAKRKSNAGRPPFKITAAVIKKTRKFAAQGLTKAQIALNLGISYETLNEKSKKYIEFSEAIDLGRAEGIQTVTNALFKNCKNGDSQSIKYFLNNRDNDNWKDRVVNTHEGSLGLTDLSSDELDRKIKLLEQTIAKAQD